MALARLEADICWFGNIIKFVWFAFWFPNRKSYEDMLWDPSFELLQFIVFEICVLFFGHLRVILWFTDQLSPRLPWSYCIDSAVFFNSLHMFAYTCMLLKYSINLIQKDRCLLKSQLLFWMNEKLFEQNFTPNHLELAKYLPCIVFHLNTCLALNGQ